MIIDLFKWEKLKSQKKKRKKIENKNNFFFYNICDMDRSVAPVNVSSVFHQTCFPLMRLVLWKACPVDVLVCKIYQELGWCFQPFFERHVCLFVQREWLYGLKMSDGFIFHEQTLIQNSKWNWPFLLFVLVKHQFPSQFLNVFSLYFNIFHRIENIPNFLRFV